MNAAMDYYSAIAVWFHVLVKMYEKLLTWAETQVDLDGSQTSLLQHSF